MADQEVINLADFDLGEMETLEELIGTPITALDLDNLPIKTIRAMLWIVRRRTEPELRFDALKSIKFSELDFRIDLGATGTDEGAADANPPAPAGDSEASPSAGAATSPEE